MKTKIFLIGTIIVLGLITIVGLSSFAENQEAPKYLTLMHKPAYHYLTWADENGKTEHIKYEVEKASINQMVVQKLNEKLNEISKKGYQLVNIGNNDGTVYYVFEKI